MKTAIMDPWLWVVAFALLILFVIALVWLRWYTDDTPPDYDEYAADDDRDPTRG